MAEIHARAQPDLVGHEHQILGGQIAGCAGRERAATQPADAGIEDADARLEGDGGVGQPQRLGIMQVGRQPPDVDVAGDQVDQPPDREWIGVADGVGDGDLVHAPVGDLSHDGHRLVRRDRPLERAYPGRHDIEACAHAVASRALDQEARRVQRLARGVVGVAQAERLTDGRPEGHGATTAGQRPLIAALVDHQPGQLDVLTIARDGRAHDRVSVGQLRHGLWMDKARDLDVAQPRRRHAVDQPAFLRRVQDGRLVLQTISRPDFVDLEQVHVGQ